MRRLRRGAGREPAGAYELRFRLEGSYRPWGILFATIGLAGFLIALATGELWLCIATGPACGGGLWLYVNDPREYLVVEPRRRRLKLLRVYGRKTKVRREYRLDEFVRLETVRYLNRPKGLRCMILLFGADGAVEKVDDRIDDDSLTEVCAEVAEAAGLAFVDKGRIDPEPRRRRGLGPRQDDTHQRREQGGVSHLPPAEPGDRLVDATESR